MASWSFFVGAPFGKSPQLAAVASTFFSVLFAILAQVFGRASNVAAFIFSIIFPPGFYIFSIRAIAGFENHQIHTNILNGDPDNHLRLLPLILAAIVRFSNTYMKFLHVGLTRFRLTFFSGHILPLS